jgi:protein-disulfide isomerase
MKLDSVVTSILVICAIITTGVVVKRGFLPSPSASPIAEQKPGLVPHWQDYLGNGVRMGPPQAKVQLIEFGDFECPYCGDLHKKLKATENRYPNQIAVTYFHFPIPGHRFALPAARVVECAGEQGRFEAMHDELFQRQDEIGLKPWDDYAGAAGVPDLAAFSACIKKTDPISRVEDDKALGAKLDIHATPTIIINGWKLGRPPTEEELDNMVKKILAGKSPVS